MRTHAQHQIQNHRVSFLRLASTPTSHPTVMCGMALRWVWDGGRRGGTGGRRGDVGGSPYARRLMDEMAFHLKPDERAMTGNRSGSANHVLFVLRCSCSFSPCLLSLHPYFALLFPSCWLGLAAWPGLAGRVGGLAGWAGALAGWVSVGWGQRVGGRGGGAGRGGSEASAGASQRLDE